jgi:hypothetical protein
MQPAAPAADNYGAMPSLRRLPLGALALLLLALGGCQDDSNPPGAAAAVQTAIASSIGELQTPAAQQPEFLTPVAQALDLNLQPYWLGESFEAEGSTWEVSGVSAVRGTNEDPILDFTYSAQARGGGYVLLRLASYSPESANAEERRERAPDDTLQSSAQVGDWNAHLLEVPGETAGVTDAITIYVDSEDALVVAQVSSGTSGIPGDDANPLIDKELLIATLAEHLRPYPD